MLNEGDLVIVIEEDKDIFLINQVVKLILYDNTPEYPYQILFRNEEYWVKDVIKVTPLIEALV